METLRCPVCAKEFSHSKDGRAKFMLTRHMQSAHGQAKRKYVRVKKTPELPVNVTPPARPMPTFLCYCPHCGLNLSQVAAALTVAERMK